MINNLYIKIKNFLNLNKQQKQLEKIALLEQRILVLEKANLVILAKLLQLGTNPKNSKITNKNGLLMIASKDCNEGNTPTYH